MSTFSSMNYIYQGKITLHKIKMVRNFTALPACFVSLQKRHLGSLKRNKIIITNEIQE
jgi:hypothetical protein